MDIQENSLTFDKLALAVHERRCMRKKKPVIRRISESSADRQRMVINYADLLAIAVMPKKNSVFLGRKVWSLAYPSGASDEKDSKYESMQEAQHVNSSGH